MSARDELAEVIRYGRGEDASVRPCECDLAVSDAILADGWRKPRTITTAAELAALPFGSAVETSDESDTVVLKCEGEFFRNQSGCQLSWTDLWRFGTGPFTVLYEPAE